MLSTLFLDLHNFHDKQHFISVLSPILSTYNTQIQTITPDKFIRNKNECLLICDIPSHLKIADIAIVPSMWDEPFGLTVIEAMAAGLPLITTRSGGIPEICEGVAIIVERDNIVENLINAIQDLYQNLERREQMKRASLERALSFDKELFAQNFFNALPQV